MRKVILQEFVTLDGLAAGPNDRVDYSIFAGHWPNITDKEENHLRRHELGREDAVTFQRRLPLTS